MSLLWRFIVPATLFATKMSLLRSLKQISQPQRGNIFVAGGATPGTAAIHIKPQRGVIFVAWGEKLRISGIYVEPQRGEIFVAGGETPVTAVIHI